jgi:hypothetical protein
MSNCKVGTRVSVKYSQHTRHSFPRLGPIAALIFVVSPHPLLFELGRPIVLIKSAALQLLKSCRYFWQWRTLFFVVVGAVLDFCAGTVRMCLAALHLLHMGTPSAFYYSVWFILLAVPWKRTVFAGHKESSHCTIFSGLPFLPLSSANVIPWAPPSQAPLVHIHPLM